MVPPFNSLGPRGSYCQISPRTIRPSFACNLLQLIPSHALNRMVQEYDLYVVQQEDAVAADRRLIVMEETLARVVHDEFGRLDGPLHFRILLQPTMAIIFAIRDGLKDARQGRPAYFWSLFTEPMLRRELLRGGWRSISRIFILAVVLDVA